MVIEQVSLYKTSAGSDKEYHVFVEGGRSDALYVVKTLHGPRGRATVAQTKTPEPVGREAALALLARLTKQKLASGYTRGESGRVHAGTYAMLGATQTQHSGWDPALLEPVSLEGVASLLDDPCWMMTEKMDGERRAVQIQSARVLGINRRGLYVHLPQTWGPWLARLDDGTMLDGEQVGETLHVFDALQIGQQDLRQRGYADRLQVLERVFGQMTELGRGESPIKLLLPTASSQHKRELLREVEVRGGEGVVLRHAASPYEVGRSARALKFKFVETSSCIVSRVNEGRRSVGLALLDGHGALCDVGNVAVPANYALPPQGSVVEVRYMHLNEGGSLYQPVYSGLRKDMEAQDCLLSQIARVRAKTHTPTSTPAVPFSHPQAGEGDEISAEPDSPQPYPRARA